MLYLYRMTTKQKVFQILTENQGSHISGQKLAAECRVSRAAIWKAVKSIREDGFLIEGTNNSGYSLCQSQTSDAFSREALQFALAQNFPQLANSHIECFTTIDSTNTYAKKLLLESGKNFHHTIIAAESQTAGRGRIGRSFESPAGTGVYFSLIVTPQGGITQPAFITASTAVAVSRAIKKLYGVQPAIKWINDIYIENNGQLKKCAGILTEGITNFESGQIESAVIGIGVNISPSDQIKKSEAASVAGYLTKAEETGAETSTRADLPSRCRFIAEIAGQVFGILNESPDKVISEYKKQVFLIGQKITVHPLIGDDKSAYSATAIDIDENAALVVKLEDGSQRTLNSGEVTLH